MRTIIIPQILDDFDLDIDERPTRLIPRIIRKREKIWCRYSFFFRKINDNNAVNTTTLDLSICVTLAAISNKPTFLNEVSMTSKNDGMAKSQIFILSESLFSRWLISSLSSEENVRAHFRANIYFILYRIRVTPYPAIVIMAEK